MKEQTKKGLYVAGDICWRGCIHLGKLALLLAAAANVFTLVLDGAEKRERKIKYNNKKH